MAAFVDAKDNIEINTVRRESRNRLGLIMIKSGIVEDRFILVDASSFSIKMKEFLASKPNPEITVDQERRVSTFALI